MKLHHAILLVPAVAAFAASASENAEPATASATLVAASDSHVSGTLTFTASENGVLITGRIAGVEPSSTHGFHIHEKGDCSAPDATSAGGHFNPHAHAHGQAGQGEHHAGDIPNLVADAEGNIAVDVAVSGVSLRDGGIGDIAGRAIVLHAAPDDYTSQPAGNSGARIACGVIE